MCLFLLVTKEPIEVNYYYKLKTPTIDTSTGGELAEGGDKTEDGKWEIKAGEEIKYRVSYSPFICSFSTNFSVV